MVTKIPRKINQSLVGLYTDYQGDHTQGMVVVIGAPVEGNQEAPKGMVKKIIPAVTYAVFTAQGPEDIGKTWGHIWSTDLKRTFVADFELYKMDGSSIEIYIGIEAE